MREDGVSVHERQGKNVSQDMVRKRIRFEDFYNHGGTKTSLGSTKLPMRRPCLFL